ncbi:TPA: squalene/phytoene synthase family protein [Candidatus Micrarchaeota archaeon]|nr:squalene/phytoene synthase family protein [Candidatus Micrarchaeota archaeon]
MNDAERCWEILPKVSRSFALCIKILPKPLNGQMMVSYLIYRILDTIEDSDAPLDEKGALFEEFLGLLKGRKLSEAAAGRCASRMLSALNYTYEKELLESTLPVLRLYFSQPAGVRRYIFKRGKSMARGMYEFQKRGIVTFADQNRYSHYVAGVIGYLFNDLLFFNGIITGSLKRKLRRYAKHFGLALQKVNILRDIAADIRENRHYWPSAVMHKYGLTYENLCLKEKREAAMKVLSEQIRNAREYLVSAMKYVTMLPEKAVRVRMFCLIPLFMAIESYVKCAGNAEVFENGKVVKISREQVYGIVAKSRVWGSSNERLVKWFLSAMGGVSPELQKDYAQIFAAAPAARNQ